jgi:hypothetical protein
MMRWITAVGGFSVTYMHYVNIGWLCQNNHRGSVRFPED